MTRFDLGSGLLSALLFLAAFPPLDLFPLIWIAPVPFLLRLERLHKTYDAVCFGAFTGYFACLGVIWWLCVVTVPGTLLLALWTALPWILTAAVSTYVPRQRLHRLWLLPTVWAAAEWLRATGYTSFAWCELAHPLAGLPPLRRTAAFLGTWGLSWTVLLTAVGLSELIVLAARWRSPDGFRAACGAIGVVIPAALYISLPILNYGQTYTLGKRLQVAAVQGNFDLDEKHGTEYEVYLERYRELSLEAADRGAEIVFWPESAVVHPIRYWYSVVNRIQGIVNEVDRPILVGAVDAWYDPEEGSDRSELYNTAVLWSPGAVEPQFGTPCEIDHLPSYRKRHLIPFGETVPFGEYWPFSLFEAVVEAAGAGIFEPGRAATIFEGPQGIRFGVAICFESSLAGQVSAYRRDGAQFLAVISNDAWFRHTPGAEQHLRQSMFRAAENNMPVVHATNTGITALIDRSGAVTDRIPWFKPGVLTGKIKVKPRPGDRASD